MSSPMSESAKIPQELARRAPIVMIWKSAQRAKTARENLRKENGNIVIGQ
jgi:hypothetical protein